MILIIINIWKVVLNVKTDDIYKMLFLALYVQQQTSVYSVLLCSEKSFSFNNNEQFSLAHLWMPFEENAFYEKI